MQGFGLVVGDVVGHDIRAAAVMGQLRSMLRALAYETGGGPPAAPSDVVRRLDRVASRLDVPRHRLRWRGARPAG